MIESKISIYYLGNLENIQGWEPVARVTNLMISISEVLIEYIMTHINNEILYSC